MALFAGHVLGQRRARALAWLGKTDEAIALARSANALARSGDERYLALAACFELESVKLEVGSWDTLEQYRRELFAIPAVAPVGASPSDALVAFLHPPLVTADPLTTAPRNSRLDSAWWWTSAPTSTFLIEQTDSRVPIQREPP